MTAKEVPHGTATGYVYHGCRCDECRAANTVRCRTRRRAASLPDGDPRHGTVNGYGNYGCRCGPCRAAHNERMSSPTMRGYRRKWVRSVRGTLEPGARQHGTVNGYRVYGCRCDQCSEAAATDRRRKAARMQASGDVPHGTLRGYNVGMCRCDACRAAIAAYRQGRKQSRTDTGGAV